MKPRNCRLLLQCPPWLNGALVMAAAVLLSSCSGAPEQKADPGGNIKSSAANGRQVLGDAPAFELTDQTGATFRSDELFGKAWVANFIFTRCTSTCPRQTGELKKLQDGLAASGVRDVRFVSFSVDPANDTPPVLQAYADSHGADTQYWRFLTGPREVVWELVSKQGFKLPVAEDDSAAGGLFHSPHFVLVDPQMQIRGLYDSGSNTDLARLKSDIKQVLDERVLLPADILDPPWMAQRRADQLEAAKAYDVFHDFRFTDRRRESKIAFRHKIVDDAGKTYKAVHYDHGNGVAIADVDGDGRLDVYFVTQAGPNGLWRNKGNGEFEDITSTAGVAVADRIGVTASFADVDNDGDADLYVTSVRGGNVLFENDGHGVFHDISAESGLGHRGHSSGAVFFDYDRDGLLDVFLTNVGKYTNDEVRKVTMEAVRGESGDYEFYSGYSDAFAGHLKSARDEQSILFRNLGGRRFEDVSDRVELKDVGWSGDATATDFNSDGWPDLYVLNMQGDDHYYVNQGGKRFQSAGRDVFPKTPWGSMGVKSFDYDDDGDFDLYVTDMHSDMAEDIGPELEKQKNRTQYPETMLQTVGTSIFGNAFYRNEGEGEFREISDEIGAENYWPWGISVDDLNADGFDDVFIASSMNYPFRYGVNSVLLNRRGEMFLDSEFVLGIEPRAGSLGVPWFTLDSKETPARKSVAAQVDKLPPYAVIWSARGSRSSVIFDYDDDGDLDIITNEFNDVPQVLESNLSEKNPELRYLKVKLEGVKSNRSGVGAVVTLHVGDRKLMKANDGKSGYLSQSDYPLYFGLDGAGKVDSIVVAWPSGVKQTVAGPIDANQMLTIKEQE